LTLIVIIKSRCFGKRGVTASTHNAITHTSHNITYATQNTTSQNTTTQRSKTRKIKGKDIVASSQPQPTKKPKHKSKKDDLSSSQPM